jgi:hypothetical protein
MMERRAPLFPPDALPKKLDNCPTGTRPAETVPVLQKAICRIIERALDCQTALDFRQYRDNHFGQYANLALALSGSVTPQPELIQAALREQERSFAALGPELFGLNETNTALHYAVTLRKVYRIIPAIGSRPISANQVHTDLEFLRQYIPAILFAGFHHGCLLAAMHKKRKLTPSILREVLCGFQFVEHAYVVAMQAHDLRFPEKILHPLAVAARSISHETKGDVTEIAKDAIEEFEAWRPYRERANA